MERKGMLLPMQKKTFIQFSLKEEEGEEGGENVM
jgi:hypothetical protein